ncbi:endonuclease 8-like 3 [Tubulanus polymorphus]|uniref:endonuclease 8-like 3 n=1 Tax=Tubulanus polymorphus TaxID=672921 RepID=UPI003DA35CF3
MVEGPGCKLKGEKIKTKFNGAVVHSVTGTAIEKTSKKDKPIPFNKNFYALVGRMLEDVRSLGKELFMFFGDICLRVHFLMAGSHWVNGKKGDSDPSKPAEKPILEILLNNDKLSFHKSAVEIRKSSLCFERYENLKHLDICSAIFNHKAAVQLVMQQKDRQICDILLDQDILPGVGNIIKNEGLFDSGIKPDEQVGKLSEAHVSHLIRMTRDFSMLFYKCRKTGQALNKYYKVYNQKICKQCQSKIVITRMGDDNDRMTYFCPQCQNNDLKARTLPSKNSLLGWVINSQDEHSSEWTCLKCTLINPATSSNCQACNSLKTAANKSNTGHAISKSNILSSNDNRKRLVSDDIHQPDSKRLKQNPAIQTRNAESGSKIPCCKGHNVKCSLLEVRKQGDNYRRMFYACKLPKAKQCNFFKWADDEFPLCEHSKRCVMRTVLKQGANNGKKFFACSLNKNKQCKFFQWAEGYD